MLSPRCIVIGASAGGLEPLRTVVSRLPASFPIPVFVVMHVAPYHESMLPGILSRSGPLPAIHPEDHTRIEPSRIYVAPPDHHLLVDGDYVAVKRGPKENGFRPSIDALFRSAAYSYGPGTTGVVLSGALNDGTSGLWSIQRLGGVTMIQNPNEAVYPSMPRSALEYVEPDYRGSPDEIGSQLAWQPETPEHAGENSVEYTRRMAIETQIAAGLNLPESVVLGLGELTEFTCPECRGALVRIVEGKLERFRCHTGHAYTADALLAALTGTVAELVWQATRGSQEVSMLLQHMAQHMQDNGEARTADAFRVKAHRLSRQASELQKMAVGQESLSEESLREEPLAGTGNPA